MQTEDSEDIYINSKSSMTPGKEKDDEKEKLLERVKLMQKEIVDLNTELIAKKDQILSL